MHFRGLKFGWIFLFAILLAASSSAQTPVAQLHRNSADDGLNVGVLYGDNYSYALTAPKGWVLDSESGASKGLAAVFYPKGLTWDNSPVWMYTSTTYKEEEGRETLDLKKMMDADVANYRDNRKTKQIIDAPSILTKDKKTTALVKYFLGDMNGNYEACAYIDASKVVVFIVITSPNKKGFEDDLPAFKALVGSYFYMTDKVDIQK